MSDFNPTVDLRPTPRPPKQEPKLPAASQNPPRPAFAGHPSRGGEQNERQSQRIKQELPKELEVEDKQEFQRISRPAGRNDRDKTIKAIVAFVVLLVVIGGGYWYWQRASADKTAEAPLKWYTVKLVDGEIFYGQIGNTGADPVVINNVYYNYDQVQKTEAGQNAQPNEAGSLRLVKRGKETHGPTGTLDVVRAQVLYMEELKADSKVLKAITEYEKK